jgi:rhodanese-related sulfurtransferase
MRLLLRRIPNLMKWKAGTCLLLATAMFGCELDSSGPGFAQESKKAVQDFPVPIMTQSELRRVLAAADSTTRVLLVDTRAPEEFAVSHLTGAVSWPGYTKDPLPAEATRHLADGGQVVFYCSIGYRSGEACQRARTLPGVDPTRVFNLEGGIFQWANESGPLSGGSQVHGYNDRWEKLLRPGLRARRTP